MFDIRVRLWHYNGIESKKGRKMTTEKDLIKLHFDLRNRWLESTWTDDDGSIVTTEKTSSIGKEMTKVARLLRVKFGNESY